MSTQAIVLAAGQGTRMKSALPKVLHPLAGKPLVQWVTDALEAAAVDGITVVVGYGADAVAEALPDGIATVLQAEQRGTGDAVKVALAAIPAAETVVVVPGDTPLLRGDRLAELATVHAESGAAATLLSARLDEPSGYGRILRDEAGAVTAVVEERDATPEQRALREVNTSVYAFDADKLGPALGQIDDDNHQGEYYLTDVVGILVGEGARVEAVEAAPEEVMGVNSHDHLAAAAAVVRRRINQSLMRDGVAMVDPASVYIDAVASVEPGATVLPNTFITGSSVVGAGAEVGPQTYIQDSRVAGGAKVWYSVLRGAEVGEDAEVGPFASLRPGTVLATGAKAGTFVEAKNTVIGPGSKVPHLSYMGDASIGADSNVGAGTITCNYDGFQKHETVIGDRVRIGSDTMLVAPVEVGDDAWTGAGSVITSDIAPGALGVSRSHQREVADYAARRRRRHEEQQDEG